MNPLRSSVLALSVSMLSLVACAAPSSDGDDGIAEGSAASTRECRQHDENVRTYAFHYIDPDVPYGRAQIAKVQAALHEIARVSKCAQSPVRRELAKETLARIEEGDVQIGSIDSARGIDLWGMCKEGPNDPGCGAPPAPDDRTWNAPPALRARILTALEGYMWRNRIYVTIKGSTDERELASTFVHEVNHVFNRAECNGYYVDPIARVFDPNRAFVEEFRAFVSECLFKKDGSADPESCTRFAMPRVDVYEFQYDLARVVPRGTPRAEVEVAKVLLANPTGGPATYGKMIPTKQAWPASFGACPEEIAARGSR